MSVIHQLYGISEGKVLFWLAQRIQIFYCFQYLAINVKMLQCHNRKRTMTIFKLVQWVVSQEQLRFCRSVLSVLARKSKTVQQLIVAGIVFVSTEGCKIMISLDLCYIDPGAVSRGVVNGAKIGKTKVFKKG